MNGNKLKIDLVEELLQSRKTINDILVQDILDEINALTTSKSNVQVEIDNKTEALEYYNECKKDIEKYVKEQAKKLSAYDKSITKTSESNKLTLEKLGIIRKKLDELLEKESELEKHNISKFSVSLLIKYVKYYENFFSKRLKELRAEKETCDHRMRFLTQATSDLQSNDVENKIVLFEKLLSNDNGIIESTDEQIAELKHLIRFISTLE